MCTRGIGRTNVSNFEQLAVSGMARSSFTVARPTTRAAFSELAIAAVPFVPAGIYMQGVAGLIAETRAAPRLSRVSESGAAPYGGSFDY